jgi:site-specific recombinase XerC
MLRHACGFALADQGADTRLIQDYLGHRNIHHTVHYTATNPVRLEKLWRKARKKPRDAGGITWRLSILKAQQTVLITSGNLLVLISFRSLRL